jgi:hypothetical protein
MPSPRPPWPGPLAGAVMIHSTTSLGLWVLLFINLLDLFALLFGDDEATCIVFGSWIRNERERVARIAAQRSYSQLRIA